MLLEPLKICFLFQSISELQNDILSENSEVTQKIFVRSTRTLYSKPLMERKLFI